MKRNIAALSVVFTVVLFTCGCMHKVAAPPPPMPPETIPGDTENERLQQSLFKGDQAVLSDQDIARILGTQLNLADRHSLAILNLSFMNPWSEELAETERKTFDNLVHALKASPQLTEVHLLPS